MPRKLSTEVKIMNLFLTLNEDGRRIVADFIKSQQPVTKRPKSTAPSVGRKSKPRGAELLSTQNTEGETESVLSAAGD